MTKILCFAGSARKDSYNKKLIALAADAAKQQGAQTTLVDLADYPMPLYDGDLEAAEGVPENAKKLHDLVKGHDALMISSPEYNGLPTPLLKNTIDWITRVDVKVFDGKVAGLVATSPGAMAGLRGLPHLRTLLTNLNTLVVPQQLGVGFYGKAFDDNDQLADEKQQAMLNGVVGAVITAAR